MTGDLSFEEDPSIRMLEGTKLRFTGSDPGGNQRTFIDIKNELSSGIEGDEAAIGCVFTTRPTQLILTTLKQRR